MGHIFELNDQTIWSPSRDVALCFLSQVRYLEGRLNAASGLTESMSDTLDINSQQLTEFLAQIGKHINLENNSIRILMAGVVIHLLAILSASRGLPASFQTLFPPIWLKDGLDLSAKAMQRNDAGK
jgi:hypothetical protein